MSVYRKIEKVLCDISGVFLFILALLVSFDVIGRFFDLPIKGTYEISKLIMAFVVWAGVAFVTMERGHISVDILISRLSPRLQTIFDILACLFGLLAFAIILVGSGRTAIVVARLGEVTDILELPTYPLRFMITVGAALALVELVFQLIEHFSSLLHKKGQTG